MKYLRELEVRGFRNVEKTKLSFRRGMNVVLGKNAAGKTTLLDLVGRVVDGQSANHTEPTWLTCRIESDRGTLDRELIASDIQTAQPLRPTGRMTFRDRIVLRLGATTLTAHTTDGVIVELDGIEEPQVTPFVGVLGVARHLLETRSSIAESLLNIGFSDVTRLDESLEHLGRLRELQVSRRNGDELRVTEPAMPVELHELMSSAAGAEAGRLELDFLKRCARAMGYNGGHVRFDFELKTSSGVREWVARNFRFWFTGHGDELSQESLSYGEKRLLSFFAMSDACREVMIIDELVNGLHHDWIRSCLDEIGTRQAFLTSQNPLLLDYLEFESPEDVRTGFVLCERVPAQVGSNLRWRNPTQDEAEEFFSAYETGIQRVSDILITKGFW